MKAALHFLSRTLPSLSRNYHNNLFSSFLSKVLVVGLLLFSSQVYAQTTVTVTNANDSGAGSLRAAITTAMNGTGNYIINFNAALGAAPTTINLLTNIVSPFWYSNNASTITIDGSALTNKITIRGVNVAGEGVLQLRNGNFVVRGVGITGGEVGVYLQTNGTMSNVSILNCNIFGNAKEGIKVETGYNNITIQGNNIGLDISGNVNGNGHDGILINGGSGHIVGGCTAGQANIVVGNGWLINHKDYGNGIAFWNCIGASVQGNYVGTTTGADVNKGTGATTFLGNGRHGIYTNSSSNITIGGTCPNYSGNNGFGIAGAPDFYPASGIALYVNSTNVTVQSNYIGTNNSSTTPSKIGNSQDGVTINGASGNTIQSNIICNNWHGVGVRFIANNNIIKSNIVGTDAYNHTGLGNGQVGISIESSSTGNTIGGNASVDGNTIKGNTGTSFQYNSGNNPAGKTGGAGYGVWIVISCNGNFVYNNKIGRASGDNALLNNLGDGVRIEQNSSSNIIGGVGKSNTISFNGGNGVTVDGSGSSMNIISQNSIAQNTLKGINLNGTGNGNIASPVITNTTGTTVTGTAVAGATIEIFADNSGRACDDPLKRQGATYLGFATADGTGAWSFTNAGVSSATVSATATTTALGTSEFNTCPLCVTPTISGVSAACASQTGITFSTSQNADWTITGNGTITSTATNVKSVTVTAGTNGSFTITSAVGSCSDSKTVTVNANPVTPTAGSNSPLCVGGTINLTSGTIAGVTYNWTGPNSFTSSSQNPSLSNATAAMAGTYNVTVTSTVTNCTSAAATTTVVVNAKPATPTAGSNSPLCIGGTINLTSSTLAGATYNWTGPNSFTSTSQNPSITNATAAMGGTYNVTVTTAGSGCTSAAGTTTVIINPKPVTPTAGSNSPLCIGGTIDLTSSTLAGATYNWTGPNGFTSTTQNPSLTNATAAMAGTYNVTVTTAGSGCTSAAGTVTVVVNTKPAAPTVGSNGPLCIGGTIDLTASTLSGATYSWTGPNSFSSASQNPSITNATAAMAGTYNVIVTTAGSGCTSAAGTTTVVINAKPVTPTAGSNSPLCIGGTINLTSSTLAGATYNWTGPNGFTSTTQNPSITNATAAMGGTYNVTVTTAGSGCTSAAGTTTVIINPKPVTPTAGSNSPLCIGGTIDLTSSTLAGATYNWTGPNGFTSTTQNPSLTNATAAMAGTYNVTVTTTGSGCTSAAGTTTVIINPKPATLTAGNNGPLCIGGTIDLNSSTLVGATYSWTGPNGFTSASQNPSIANATATMAGTYNVTVTVVGSGCTSAAGTTTVVVNPKPASPTAGSNSPLCIGGTIDLTSSTLAGATYNWTGPNGFTSTTQNPSLTNATAAMAGTYNVTVTTAGSGCTSAAGTTTVVVNPKPASPTAGSNGPLCIGGTIDLTSSTLAGATYNWTGPNSFTSTTQNPSLTNATAAMAGTYNVTVTTVGSGCTSEAGTTIVVVNSKPVTPTTGSNAPLCIGGTIDLTSSTVTGATYSWTGPNGFTSASQNPSLSNATAAMSGTYNVTVTTAGSGCTSAAGSIAITVNSLPTPSVQGSGPTTFCSGGSVELSTTQSYSSYVWTPGNLASATLTASSTNTYSVLVTDANGCKGTANIDVTVNENPDITLTIDPVNGQICSGQSATITANVTNGTAPYSYDWTATSGSVPDNVSSATFNPVTTTTYTIKVTDDNACIATASREIKVNQTATVSITPGKEKICEGNSTNLEVIVSGGTSPYDYKWTADNGTVPSGSNPTVTPADTTVYSVTVTDANSCGSANSDITIYVLPNPKVVAVTADSTGICGSTTVRLNVEVDGNVNDYSYSWTPDATLDNASIHNPKATPKDTTVYSVLVTDKVTGCTNNPSKDIIKINVLPNVTMPNLGPDFSICLNEWQINSNVLNLGTGKWTVLSGSAVLDSVKSDTAFFFSGFSMGENKLVYSVTGTCPAKGYTDTLTITVAPSDLTVKVVAPSDTLCNSTSIDIFAELKGTVTYPLTYYWSSVNGKDTVSYYPAVKDSLLNIGTQNEGWTEYLVVVKDGKGCFSNIDRDSSFSVGPQKLVIPNMITPNGDGLNDCWRIADVNQIDIIPGATLNVFNRWGQAVYLNKNYKNGDFCGSILADGIYFYQVQPACGKEEQKGWLHIISNTDESSNK